MDRRFTHLSAVIVKVTNRCNIRCAYCYEDIVARGADMTVETFRALATAVLSASQSERVLFVLHGGEPTILSADWFRRALPIPAEEASKVGKTASLALQTNLIHLTNEKIDLLRQHQVSIGGSLDNPAGLSSSLRPLAEKAIENYRRARAAGVSVGVLSTINGSNIRTMSAFCEWLHRDMGAVGFKANLAYAVGAGVDLSTPSAELFFDAQRQIIEYMIGTGGEFIEENLSTEILHFIETARAGHPRGGSLCEDQRCGAGSKVIGVSPTGELLPCGRFAWSDFPHSLGQLADASDPDGFNEKVDRFHALEPDNWTNCSDCEAKPICGFGCQAFIVRSKAKANIECRPTQLRYAYYRANETRLQSLYERICERRGRTALTPIQQRLDRLISLTPADERPALRSRLQERVASL